VPRIKAATMTTLQVIRHRDHRRWPSARAERSSNVEALPSPPGPTPVPPEVLSALGEPVIHHRRPASPRSSRSARGLTVRLQRGNDVSSSPPPAPAPWSPRRENIVNAGRRGTGRIGGQLRRALAEAHEGWGAKVTALEYEWGTKADPADIAAALAKNPAIQGRVRTVLRDLDGRRQRHPRRSVRSSPRTPAILVVDAISGLGATDLRRTTGTWTCA